MSGTMGAHWLLSKLRAITIENLFYQEIDAVIVNFLNNWLCYLAIALPKLELPFNGNSTGKKLLPILGLAQGCTVWCYLILSFFIGVEK
jgi:hypothetical protein